MVNTFSDNEFDKLAAQYKDIESNSLNKAVDAILSLREDNQISEELALKTIKTILNRFIIQEIRKDIQSSDIEILKDKGRKLKFMGIKYGRREEHFAN